LLQVVGWVEVDLWVASCNHYAGFVAYSLMQSPFSEQSQEINTAVQVVGLGGGGPAVTSSDDDANLSINPKEVHDSFFF